MRLVSTYIRSLLLGSLGPCVLTDVAYLLQCLHNSLLLPISFSFLHFQRSRFVTLYLLVLCLPSHTMPLNLLISPAIKQPIQPHFMYFLLFASLKWPKIGLTFCILAYLFLLFCSRMPFCLAFLLCDFWYLLSLGSNVQCFCPFLKSPWLLTPPQLERQHVIYALQKSKIIGLTLISSMHSKLSRGSSSFLPQRLGSFTQRRKYLQVSCSVQ